MPPEANAEFVCAMEDTLEVYQRPYDAQRPLGCFDEGTKPLVKEVRTPLPAAPGRPEHIAYADERHGTGNLFMLFEPLAGRREGLVTERRTAVDYAEASNMSVQETSSDPQWQETTVCGCKGSSVRGRHLGTSARCAEG